MNFFGRHTNIPEFSNSCRYECRRCELWTRVEDGLPADSEKVMTLVRKERYDGTIYFTLELQKFIPSDGWKSSEGVIAWKECDPQILAIMKEKK